MICPKCGSTVEDGSKFCLFCGAELPQTAAEPTPGALTEPPADVPVETASAAEVFAPTDEQTYTPSYHEESPAPAAENGGPYSPQIESYAPAEQVKPYAPAEQVQPSAPAQQVQPYAPAQQPQFIPPAAPQIYAQPAAVDTSSFCANCGGRLNPTSQFCPSCGMPRNGSGGQMPYAQQPAYQGYQAPRPAYSGTYNPAGEPANIPAAMIALLLDVAAFVSFFLNLFTWGSGSFKFSLFSMYDSIGKILGELGQYGFDISHLDLSKISAEGWIILGFIAVIYILFISTAAAIITALVRLAVCRGPAVIKFWSSASSAASCAMTANLLAWGGCMLFNAKASGMFDSGFSGSTFYWILNVNDALFYIFLAVSLIAVIVAGIMKTNAKNMYFTGRR